MQERTIRLGCAVAWGLWVMAVGFVLAGSVVALLSPPDGWPLVLILLTHGVLFAIAAGAATIRVIVKDSNHMLRNAFELGRDSVVELPAPRRPQRV